MAKIYIGTSGWQYEHWRSSFYPQDLHTTKWLSYYASFFDSVEVNGSFYHQTRASTAEKWKNQVSRDFIFSIKGHRFITHVKRLHEVSEPLGFFFQNFKPLAKDRHVILWQLPPRFKKDVNRLVRFMRLLPNTFRHAFEFRHETWIDGEVCQILKQSKISCAAVIQDWHEWPRLTEPVGRFVYIRFHGLEALYSSNYSDSELKEWAQKMKGWLKKGLDVYAYFNNDAAGFAVANAKTLKELVT